MLPAVWGLTLLAGLSTGDAYWIEERAPMPPLAAWTRSIVLSQVRAPYAAPDALDDATPMLQAAIETASTLWVDAGMRIACRGQP